MNGVQKYAARIAEFAEIIVETAPTLLNETQIELVTTIYDNAVTVWEFCDNLYAPGHSRNYDEVDHYLRGMLTPIVGNAQLLSAFFNTNLNRKQLTVVDAIQRSAQKLLQELDRMKMRLTL